MSLYTLSPADLRARAAGAAPRYPNASPALAGVLTDITRLSAADQAKLATAFRKAAPPRQVAARPTFKGWADFMPAYTAAREACAGVAGDRWYLDPSVALKARLPAAWVACRVVGRTAASPRDVTMPRAPFWPGEVLPLGPEYAGFGPIGAEGDVRRVAERLDAQRKAAMRRAFPRLAGTLYPEFVLEPSPDGEIDTSRLAAD